MSRRPMGSYYGVDFCNRLYAQIHMLEEDGVMQRDVLFWYDDVYWMWRTSKSVLEGFYLPDLNLSDRQLREMDVIKESSREYKPKTIEAFMSLYAHVNRSTNRDKMSMYNTIWNRGGKFVEGYNPPDLMLSECLELSTDFWMMYTDHLEIRSDQWYDVGSINVQCGLKRRFSTVEDKSMSELMKEL